MVTKNTKKLNVKFSHRAGFTLMEILVATTIFALATIALTSLFDYTLKINRRSEALRQSSQAIRNLVESVVKDIRNGQIDYGVINGTTLNTNALAACPVPALVGADTYRLSNTRLGLITPEGDYLCYYLSGTNLMLAKTNTLTQIVNPPNVQVQSLAFYIKPLCDPYSINCISYGNAAPKFQPSVGIVMKISVTLPTHETVVIPYETAVSLDKYDIPNSP